MAIRALIVLVLAAVLASCSPGRRASPPNAEKDADTAVRPALTSNPSDAAGRSYMLDAGAGAAAGVPDMERGRKINEQDCTKQVDLTAGNLRCK